MVVSVVSTTARNLPQLEAAMESPPEEDEGKGTYMSWDAHEGTTSSLLMSSFLEVHEFYFGNWRTET